MNLKGTLPAASITPGMDDEASGIFIQRLYGEWTGEDQAAFETRLERDFEFAKAWQRVEQGWALLDRHAEAPEVMTWRAAAIAEVRRANASRWFWPEPTLGLAHKWRIAAALAGLILLGAAWQISPYGYRPGEYRTDIGEQRIVELEDQSRITMDAATRLQVRFSGESRTVRLLEGQAQFSVARDSSRPFKVLAGDRTVVAVGTVFTVEYVDRRIHVAMLEGKVAVLQRTAPKMPALAPSVKEAADDGNRADTAGARTGVDEILLAAGEELHVAHDGHTIVTPQADLAAATAWREGKVIFRTEPLGVAVHRMNRYSRLQIEIDDPLLASKNISGVFEAGDTRGFVNALQRYLLVSAEYTDDDTVRLKAR